MPAFYPGLFYRFCFYHFLAYFTKVLPRWVRNFPTDSLRTGGFPGGSAGKDPACNARDHPQGRRPRINPWVGKTPGRRKWQPTPVLSGKSHGQRGLVGYSPWGSKESDITWQLSRHHQFKNQRTGVAGAGLVCISYKPHGF